MFRLLILLSAFFAILFHIPSPAFAINFAVESAPEWDALFDRNSGWTGADGIYSIPLTGNDSLASGNSAYSLWVFGDTFIGEVDTDGRRVAGSTLVNNTTAIMYGSTPDADKIKFHWDSDPEGNPQAIFIPDTPLAQPDHWYWLQDGAVIGNKVYLLPIRIKPYQSYFAVDGVAMISSVISRNKPFANYTQIDTPFYYNPTDGRGEMYLGASIMVNTDAAGSPTPDGYVYIYGTQNDPLNKKLIVGRTTPEQFEDFTSWQYWDGSGWTTSIDQSAAMTGRVSSEFSVTPLGNGRYLLVFQVDTIGPEIGIRIGESPVGPWGPIQRLYYCPEADLDPDIYTYNAKAHPHLSKPGELLISYNVNTLNFLDHFRYADIYRPRFIRLKVTK